MRSYVVKRFSHFRHSRRRRMESASLLSRESTTLSLAKPQNGHFMVMKERLIVAGGNEHSAFRWGELCRLQPTVPNCCWADRRVLNADPYSSASSSCT